MPKVPSYDNFQVAPTANSTGAFAPPSGPTAGDIGAQQMINTGNAIEQAAGVGVRIMNRELEEQNQAIAIDAVNRAKEKLYDLTTGPEGYATQKGIAALERPEGLDLADEYTGKFRTAVSDIAATIPNEVARRAFEVQAGKLSTDLYGQAQKHMVTESINYRGTVYDGAVANAQRDLALNYTDVSQGGAVDQAVKTIGAAARAKARLTGVSMEMADVIVRKEVSNAHMLAIGTALEKNDPAFAMGYMKKYGGQMDADDILRAQGLVSKEMDTTIGTQAASLAVQKAAPTVMPSNMTRLGNLALEDSVARVESGNRDLNADGSVVTSPKGAKGRMQVMDATNRDPGFGVTPARDDSLAERSRVGRDYLAALVKHYGDVPTALAAYNGGPGTVDKAMAQAKSENDPNWLARMPAESQQYVQKVLKQYEAGAGAPRRASETEVVQSALANLPANASQTAKDVATRTAVQQFKRLESDRKAADDEGVANAMRTLLTNNGDYDSLPASVKAGVPPEDVPKLIDYAKKISTGTDATNDAVYLKLTDPSYLGSLTDNQFFRLRTDLSASDWQAFAKQRAVIKTGTASNGPGELNTQAINDTVKNRLTTMGMDPTPKDGSDEAARVGVIQRYIRDSLSTAQAQAGKKFTDVETAKHIDQLFARDVTFKKTFLGFETGGQTTRPLLSIKPGDIPGPIKDRIKSDFEARNIKPSDTDILNVYLRMAAAQQSAGAQ